MKQLRGIDRRKKNIPVEIDNRKKERRMGINTKTLWEKLILPRKIEEAEHANNRFVITEDEKNVLSKMWRREL